MTGSKWLAAILLVTSLGLTALGPSTAAESCDPGDFIRILPGMDGAGPQQPGEELPATQATPGDDVQLSGPKAGDCVKDLPCLDNPCPDLPDLPSPPGPPDCLDINGGGKGPGYQLSGDPLPSDIGTLAGEASIETAAAAGCVPDAPCLDGSCPTPDFADCDDGRDNDGDGKADLSDPNCDGRLDDNECPGPTKDYRDPDGDGVSNCEDADDDGDLLTDPLEEDELSTNSQARDSDGDGIADASDLDPATGSTGMTTVSLAAALYDPASTGCDGWGSEPADPWIETFTVKWGGGDAYDSVALQEPPGWQEPQDSHLHDRPRQEPPPDLTINDKSSNNDGGEGDVTDGALSVSQDVWNWDYSNVGDVPKVKIILALRDHDGHAGGGEEVIDLAPGGGSQGSWTYHLSEEGTKGGPETKKTQGFDDCSAEMWMDFGDEISDKPLNVALYHRSHPNELVHKSDV